VSKIPQLDAHLEMLTDFGTPCPNDTNNTNDTNDTNDTNGKAG
jgi:hypothetical protein